MTKETESPSNTWFLNLGRKIRTLREDQNWSREELADRISKSDGKGISSATLMYIEAGQPANLRAYSRIAEALNFSPATLMGVPDSDAAAAGVRSFDEGVHLLGLHADTYRRELRLDLEGGAFCVHTIAGLRSDWIKGPVTLGHTARITGYLRKPDLYYTEPNFELLDKSKGLKAKYTRYAPMEGDGQKLLLHELSLPEGLRSGSVSYRYSYAVDAVFQSFAEASFIPDRTLRKFMNATGQPDIPPADLPAIAAEAAQEYRKLRPKQKLREPPCLASLCCTEFPVKQLILTVSFPEGYMVPFHEHRSWPGSQWSPGIKTLAKVPGGKPLLSVASQDPLQLKLEVDRPAMQLSYGIFWWPPEFEVYWPLYQAYLEQIRR